MITLLTILHVIVSLALILIVLLQTGKGSEMGASFGGGSSQTIFGSRGSATFLSKVTTGAAVLFMLTSLSLAYLTSLRNASVMTAAPPPAEVPVAPAAPEPPAGAPAAPEVPALPAPEAPASR